VQEGRLFLLQTRAGKRAPRAAARIALDLLEERVIDRAEARRRTGSLNREALGLPRVVSHSGQPLHSLARAAAASQGVAVGEIALDEARARQRQAGGAPVVLVRNSADTDDIAALEAAGGLLTRLGARTSHAAVVARQMGKVCLVGCADLHIDEAARMIRVGDTTLREGEYLTLDGNEGAVYAGAARVEPDYPEALVQRLEAFQRGPAA